MLECILVILYVQLLQVSDLFQKFDYVFVGHCSLSAPIPAARRFGIVKKARGVSQELYHGGAEIRGFFALGSE